MNNELPTTDSSETLNNQTPLPPRLQNAGIKSALIITGLGILSFTIGFLLVHFTIPNKNSNDSTAPCTQTANHSAEADQSVAADNAANTDDSNTDVADVSNGEEPMSADASGGGLPEVPPGATPDGVRFDGVPLYFKCWVKSTDSGASKDCDRLRVLEKRMATRLYVVDECRQAHASKSDHGLLSLGANLDFSDNTISFWSGPSSTIANAGKIGNCVRTKLAGLPLSSIEHRHEKYRLFFSVDFFDPEHRAQMLEKKRKSGREVSVIMDHVNVREEPVDGASIGRISTDSKVVFLKKNDTKEWCMVLTPQNREGWMICKALKL